MSREIVKSRDAENGSLASAVGFCIMIALYDPTLTRVYVMSCLIESETLPLPSSINHHPANNRVTSALNMASMQRVAISLLLILAAVFVFFSQTAEAATKGPKITHKVS